MNRMDPSAEPVAARAERLIDLAARLFDHAGNRGATTPADQLLRYRDERPLTSRRYDHVLKRVGERLPWVAAQGIFTR